MVMKQKQYLAGIAALLILSSTTSLSARRPASEKAPIVQPIDATPLAPELPETPLKPAVVDESSHATPAARQPFITPSEKEAIQQIARDVDAVLPAQATPQPAAIEVKAPEPKPVPASADEEPTTDLLVKRDPDLFTITPDEEKNITLNFENAELQSFIDYVAQQRGMMIIPDKAVAGNKISLNFKNPVSKTGAWNALLAVMDVAGFAMIKEFLDKDTVLYKVVPKDKKLKQPLPVFIGVSSDELPKNDATIRYVKFLNNMRAEDVKPIISSFLSNPHGLIEQKQINALIITDKASVIRSVMEVVDTLDQTEAKEAVIVLRLKSGHAKDVKNIFDSLISKEQSNNPLARLLGKRAEQTSEYFSPGTKIIPEERTNSVILLGNKKSVEKVKDFIVTYMDNEVEQTESPLRIYELQYSKAEDMVEILQEVASSSNLQSAAGQQAARTGAVRDGVKYFKDMKFMADKEGNRLIVSCSSDNDWELLQQTIAELDKAQPQVAIQMLVVTISSKSLRQLGGQFRSKTHSQFGKNIGFQSHPLSKNTFERNSSGSVLSVLGNLAEGLTTAQGSTLFSIGKIVNDIASGEGGLWAVFKALKSETDATVLSEPFLITANRTKGTLHFGEKKFIDTQHAIGTDGNLGSTSGRKEVEAATDIAILPQINLDGIIKLDVDININEFVDATGKVTQEKNLKTSVTVGNGQVLALGGFVKTSVSESSGKTPIWGDIPLFGWLAKNKDRTEDKEYVFMFLSPTIIKPRTEPGVEPYTKMRLHRATKHIEQGVGKDASKDPIHKWFFVTDKNTYAHKVVDFANARYQPTNVDLKNDPFYRSETKAQRNHRLHIADEAHSPQAYIRAKKAAHKQVQPTPAPAIATTPLAAPQPIPAAPAMQQQKVALPLPAPRPQPASVVTPPAPVVKHQTSDPIAPQKASPAAQSLEGKREQLRQLLSSSSLLELLGSAPQEQQSAPAEKEEQRVAEVEPEPIEQTPHLIRRQGLKRFIQQEPEIEDSPLHSSAGRRSLASFLATPEGA